MSPPFGGPYTYYTQKPNRKFKHSCNAHLVNTSQENRILHLPRGKGGKEKFFVQTSGSPIHVRKDLHIARFWIEKADKKELRLKMWSKNQTSLKKQKNCTCSKFHKRSSFTSCRNFQFNVNRWWNGFQREQPKTFQRY